MTDNCRNGCMPEARISVHLKTSRMRLWHFKPHSKATSSKATPSKCEENMTVVHALLRIGGLASLYYRPTIVSARLGDKVLRSERQKYLCSVFNLVRFVLQVARGNGEFNDEV